MRTGYAFRLAAAAFGLAAATLARAQTQEPPPEIAPDDPMAVVETTEEYRAILPETTRRDRETVFKSLPKPNPKFRVTKVHEFTNDSSFKPAGNRALAFERQYWNYGAILSQDRFNRIGQYFVITWVNGEQRGDFTARFEYRQRNTQDQVRELKLEHKDVSGAQRSTFAVLGKPFRRYGPVTSWRFTVWRGSELVAEEQSFVW